MLKLNLHCLKEKRAEFERAGIRLPPFDIAGVREASRATPVWLHFGTGNLFKGYHAALAQRLIEGGYEGRGIIAAEPFDYELIRRVWEPYDLLGLRVVLKAVGEPETELVASVSEAIAADSAGEGWERMREIFRAPSLQIASLSITEKGYDLGAKDGGLKPEIQKELDRGPGAPVHAMTKLCALCLERWRAGGRPIALLSTDNFSHNGDRLAEAVLRVAAEWKIRDYVDRAFVDWLSRPSSVSFPLSMIDKITPYPSERILERLETLFTGMEIVKTAKNSVSAPFVNTEESEYLVIEDLFPNGRPPLEQAGVYITDRQTVDRVERMKVCACLNPLHTALAVFGCLLSYRSIADEMGDPDLSALAEKLGRGEGMPVLEDPLIIRPSDFMDDLLNKRLPNANIPDTPQRIATDTSQKLGIRFGETIKLYAARKDLGTARLVLIPLVIAAWCRYLLGLDDEGRAFTPSPDPLLEELRRELEGVRLGEPATASGRLRGILSRPAIFSLDLYEAGLGGRIESYFTEFLAGPGAVRKTLRKYLGRDPVKDK
jgi:fructuronate reductase